MLLQLQVKENGSNFFGCVFLSIFFPSFAYGSVSGKKKRKETKAHKQKPQKSFENWDSFAFTSDKSTLYFTIIAERTGAREWTLIESQLQIVIVSTSYKNNTISYAQVLHKIYIESMHTKIINRRNELLFYMHKSIQYVRDKLKKKWDAKQEKWIRVELTKISDSSA